MNNATVQVDLVRLLGFNQDFLRLVTLLGGENLIGFGGSDGERSFDGTEFIFLDEAGMC